LEREEDIDAVFEFCVDALADHLYRDIRIAKAFVIRDGTNGCFLFFGSFRDTFVESGLKIGEFVPDNGLVPIPVRILRHDPGVGVEMLLPDGETVSMPCD